MACQAFQVLRENSDMLITLFLLMVRCQMPQLTRRDAISWIPNQLVVSSHEVASRRTPVSHLRPFLSWR